MKIDGLTPPNGSANSRPTGRPAGAAAASDAPQVQLSSASAALGGDAEVNFARIQEIRQAILEGRFAVNSSAIADRLISSARELLDAQRRG